MASNVIPFPCKSLTLLLLGPRAHAQSQQSCLFNGPGRQHEGMQLQHPLAERDGNIRDNEQLDMVGVEVWMRNVSEGVCTHSVRMRVN